MAKIVTGKIIDSHVQGAHAREAAEKAEKESK
jgi:hypothetical protein